MRTTLSSLFAILLFAVSAIGYSGSANADPHNPALYGGAPCHTHWRIQVDSHGREINREPLAEHCAPVHHVVRHVPPVIVHRPPVVLVPPPPVIINHGPRNHFRLRTRDFGIGVGWN